MGDRIKIDPAYQQRLAEAGLDSVSKVLAVPCDKVLARAPNCLQFEVNGQPNQPALYVKRFSYPDWRTRLHFLGRCFFGRSRAHREFRCLRTMHRLGIQSSRPLAVGERRRFRFLTDSFLVTEGVPASDSLRDFAVRYFHKAASPRGRQLKRAMMAQLADQIRLMHDRHFCHGDLTWENILIRPTPSNDFEFFFVNALRGRRAWLPRKRRRICARDLAGIDAISGEFLTRADKIRFIKRYLRVERLSEKHRLWMEHIQEMTRRQRRSSATFSPPPTAGPGTPRGDPQTLPSQVQTGVHPRPRIS